LSPARKADPDLDALIEEITVDAYDDDEQLQGFANAFDEDANFPYPGNVVGEEVEVLSVSVETTGASLSPLASAAGAATTSPCSTLTFGRPNDVAAHRRLPPLAWLPTELHP